MAAVSKGSMDAVLETAQDQETPTSQPDIFDRVAAKASASAGATSGGDIFDRVAQNQSDQERQPTYPSPTDLRPMRPVTDDQGQLHTISSEKSDDQIYREAHGATTPPAPKPPVPGQPGVAVGTNGQIVKQRVPPEPIIDPLTGYPTAKIRAATSPERTQRAAQGLQPYTQEENEILAAVNRNDAARQKFLEGAQKYVVDPFEKMSEAGRKAGAEALEKVVFEPPGLSQGATDVMKKADMPAARGVVRAVGGTVGGVAADPRMWPFFFAGPEVSPALRMATGAGFAGQMGYGAVQQASELGKIMDNPDIPQDQKWELGANAVLSALMAGTGGAHLALHEGLLHDFSRLAPEDQAQIRQRIRAKSPDLATEMDRMNQSGGAAPVQTSGKPAKPAQPAIPKPGETQPRPLSAGNVETGEAAAQPEGQRSDLAAIEGRITQLENTPFSREHAKAVQEYNELQSLRARRDELQGAAEPEAPAAPTEEPAQPERRLDIVTRKRIDEMSHEEAQRTLRTDELTGFNTRRAFLDDQQKQPAKALGALDLDGLKAVNDRLGGHDSGDLYIQEVARLLRETGLNLYRTGGDEFYARGDSTTEELKGQLEKANQTIQDHEFEFTLSDGTQLRVKGLGLSYGVGTDWRPGENDRFNVPDAEKALYDNKQQRFQEGRRGERGEFGRNVELRQQARPEDHEGAGNPEGPREEAHQHLAAVAAAAHNAGDHETATAALRALVRERLGKRDAEPRARETRRQAPKEEKSFRLKAPPKDLGVHQFIDTLPEHQRDYAKAFYGTLKRDGEQAALENVDAHSFGVPEREMGDIERLNDRLAELGKEPGEDGSKELRSAVETGKGESRPAGYGSRNTVFTADKRDAALARLREKMGRLHAGIDPEVVRDLVDIGGYHFEAGIREFADWSKQVIADVGDWVKPYLKAIHEEISNELGEGTIETEQAHEAGHPGRGEERPEVQVTGGEGRLAPQRAPAQAVRGTEEEREAPEPSGVKRAAGVERGEPVHPERPTQKPSRRTRFGADTAEERAAGRGRGKRERGADGKPVEAVHHEETPHAIEEEHSRQDSRNFRYPDPSQVGKGGEMSKIDANIAAIRLLKKLTEEGRHATPEEQDILAKYTGWGGLSGIFNNRYERQYADRYEALSDLTSTEELRGIQRSTINAHYTSPEVIDFMWKLAKKMGFDGGRVIEPGMGVGYFFGLMPKEMREHPDTRLLGVELDPTTGRIAQELYQGAKILNTGYEKVQIPDNSLDYAIGNVPFADVKPFDPRYNKLSPRPTLHDYYFLKTLDKVRPGGIVSFITSRYTMDKVDSRIREMIADRADLVAAYRLPNTAFKGVAGTEVTADLMILRKREAGETRGGEAFRDIVPHKEGIKINQYFQAHPENMFGEMTLGGTMYGKGEPTLEAKGELGDHLNRAIGRAPEDVYGYQASEPTQPAFVDPTERAPDHIKEGQFYLHDGALKMKRNGVPGDLPKELLKFRTTTHIKAAIGLREKASAVLQQMLADKDDAPLKPLQAALNSAYDSYTKHYGSTHSRELREAFGSDPDFGLLLALENQDGEAGRYVKADIFTKRTMRPWEPIGALPDEPESWLPASLSAKGKLDPGYIAELAGKDAKEVIRTLEKKSLIFRDPESNEYSTADEYLSGPVREKLETARRAADVDDRFQKNVEALEKVQPKKVPIAEIQPKLGMSWIEGAIYEAFIHDMAETPEYQRQGHTGYSRYGRGTEKPVSVRLDAADNWAVTYGRDFNGVPLHNKFGTKDVAGAKILDDTINLRQTNVYFKDENGKPKLDKVATLAAREAQQRLKDAFSKWFYDSTDYHHALEAKYNRTFNGTRLREFDGSHLTFPGMNPEWTPRSHQANAIWRTVVHGRGLLAHAVGAGKTLEMIASGMEMRRLGISRKNMYAVPNNMVGQWTRDFARTYPASRVLAAPGKGFEGRDARNEFMAKAATGDWDAIIVPHSVFDMVPVSDEWQAKTINKELEAARESLAAVQEDESMGQQQKKRTIKQMEKNILKYEARLEKLASGKKDNALRFDQLGVDTLFVDEAHRYKNLQVHTSLSNVAGVPTTASQRALDMLMKSQYMLETHNGRGVVFATGTPVTNTIAETYNMTRFVAPDSLEKAGIRNFDQWRANFADEVTSWEYAPDGVTFRPVTSLSQFINVPELATMFRTFADVKTKEDLNLPVPKADRKDITVRVTDDQNPLLQQIADRAERMRTNPRAVDPKVDNWLKLSSDARKISLDPRLYVSELEDHPDSKLNAAVREAKRIYDETKDKSGLQIIFSDFFATHDPQTDTETFNALKDMKEKLVAQGIPASEIAIVTDYSKGQMDQLQEAARRGIIRVLMGSTEKLGVGLNVQTRLKAIHHLDQPWRPADVEQREGRILRQGNQFPEVEILRYISEPQSITSPKAFDLQMFQKLERKSKFIDQFMQGGINSRRMEEAAGRAMLTPQDFAIAKAQATGNPDAMKKIQLEHETNRLYMLNRDWESKKANARYQAKFSDERAADGRAQLAEAEKLKGTYEAWQNQPEEDRVSAVIDGREFRNTKEKKASLQIQEYMNGKQSALELAGQTYEIQGVAIPVRTVQKGNDANGQPRLVAEYQLGGWHQFDLPQQFVPSVVSRLRNLDHMVGVIKDEIEQNTQHAASYRKQLEERSPYEDKLNDAETQLLAVNKRLGIGVDKIEEQLGDVEPGEAEAQEPEEDEEEGDIFDKVSRDQEPGPGERPGPGGKSAYTGNETGRTDFEQLIDAIAANSPKRTLRDRIRAGADLGASNAHDSFSAALGRIKGGIATLVDLYKHAPEYGDYEKATGAWSGADQRSALDLHRFQETIKRAVPKKLTREAISNWIEAGGDDDVLRERAAASAQPYKGGYIAALKLTDAERTIARNIMNAHDATLQEAIKAGILEQGVENYVQHIYKDKPEMVARIRAEQNFNALKPNPSFAKRRVLPTYFDAEQLGFKPKDKDVGYLTAVHQRSLREALAARGYIKSLMGGKASDDRALIAPSWASTKEIGDPGDQAYLVKPNLKPGEQYADYMKLDHPALRSWKWSTVIDGKPVFVQGDAVVHPDIFRDLKNNLSPSAIRTYEKTIAGRTFRPGAAALRAQGELKNFILSFSGFHQMTVGAHALEHRVGPFNLPELDLNNKTQAKLVDHGLMVAHFDAEEAFGEGLASGGLVTKIPGVGPLYDTYRNYLFKDYIPKLKMKMALAALDRNLERYQGKLSTDQIYALTARQANAAFGGLNYRMMGRNKTLQDTMRLFLMAPDFFEARGRFVGQAARPHGREQLTALMLGAAVLYTAARVANKIADDDPHWDKPFSVVYHGKEYQLRTIQGDLESLATDPRRFFANRLGPVASLTLKEPNPYRKKNEGVFEKLMHYGEGLTPIPAQPFLQPSRDSNAQKTVETILKMLGISEKSASNRYRH